MLDFPSLLGPMRIVKSPIGRFCALMMLRYFCIEKLASRIPYETTADRTEQVPIISGSRGPSAFDVRSSETVWASGVAGSVPSMDNLPTTPHDAAKAEASPRGEPNGGRSDPVTCFVIGPIGDRLADAGTPDRETWEQAVRVLEEVIEPACKTHGLEVIRSDNISQPGEIPEQVFILLRDADVVVADVTGGNPNVMYELGLRHAGSRCTIQIGEYGQLPFDISVVRTILFKRTAVGFIDAREELTRAIAECLDGRDRPVSATRVLHEGRPPGFPPTGQREEGVSAAEEEEPPGFLELWAAMEEAFPEMNQSLTRVAEIGEEVTALFSDSTAQIGTSDKQGRGASGRLAIATRLAERLKDPVTRMEQAAEEYERLMAAVDAGVLAIIERVEREPNELDQLPNEMTDQLDTLSSHVREMMSSSTTLIGQYEDLGNISRVLRLPSRRLAGAIRRVATASAPVLVWQSRLSSVRQMGRTDHSAIPDEG